MLIGMIATRAFLRRCSAFVDVSTYEAYPFDGLLTLPHSVSVDKFKAILETVVMALLN